MIRKVSFIYIFLLLAGVAVQTQERVGDYQSRVAPDCDD